jgi:hypothetical protein
MSLYKHYFHAVHSIRWLRIFAPAAVASALLAASPAQAESGGNGKAEWGLGGTAETVAQEVLANAHAKGLEPQVTRPSDDPGVILWDETGSVRRTSVTQSVGSGGQQAILGSLGSGAGSAVSGAINSLSSPLGRY